MQMQFHWHTLGMMVTRLAWMAARLVSSNRPTRYASAASCSASTADDWKRRSVLKSCSQRGPRASAAKRPSLEFGAQVDTVFISGQQVQNSHACKGEHGAQAITCDTPH